MDLGAILEVAIGIIFVWIVLSLTTIQVQEWITTRLDKRAKDMEEAIEEMLANKNLKAQFYDHPVIRGLTSKKRNEPSRTAEWLYKLPLIKGFTKEKRKLPSYIPRQQFALALFDVIMTAGTESSLLQQSLFEIREEIKRDQKMSSKEAVITELNVLIEFARSAAATEAGTALTKNTIEVVKDKIDKFKQKYPNLEPILNKALKQAADAKTEIDGLLANEKAPKGDDALASLRKGVTALSVISPEVNQTLNALLLNVEEYVSQGETHIAKARQNVERWFDDSMDRVSGVFKRYSQKMALLIGFMVALLLNVDSVNLTLYLWSEPSVRQVLVAQASKYELPQDEFQNNPQQAMQQFRNQFAGLHLPVGWGLTDGQGAVYRDVNCQLFPGEEQSFGIPLFIGNKCLTPPETNNQTNLLTKLLGIFITALAAMQGAPFWFDMLKRVVNIRGTGPNPVEKGK